MKTVAAIKSGEILQQTPLKCDALDKAYGV